MAIDIDQLYKSISILNALKDNIAPIKNEVVTDIYVNEFKKVLDKLRSLSLSVDDFDIPSALVQPRVTSFSSSHTSYSNEKYIEKHYLLVKIDSILNYLNLLLEKQPPQLGFPKPNK